MKRAACLAASLFILVGCETAETTKPRHLSTSRGLTERQAGLGNKVLERASDPKAVAKYERVIVERVRVAQTKDTRANERTAATSQEAQKLAARFQEILKEELGAHYQITTRRSRNTAVVRATITDLRASQPGVFLFNYLPYASAVTTGISVATGETVGAGSTTVEIEVLDSYSRRQVYALVDQFSGSRLQPAGLERWGQSEAAMRAWARKVRRGLQGVQPRQGSAAAAARSGRGGAAPGTGRGASAAAPRRTTTAPAGSARSKGSATVEQKKGLFAKRDSNKKKAR